jgi:curved DNA-binding protein
MPVQFRDYYETLGVPKTATRDDIRKAFRQLARQFHPDVAKDKKTAEEKFKQINEAYEVLSDSAKREKYDRMGADWQQYEQAGAPGGRPGRAGQPGGGARWQPGGGGVEFDFGGTGYSDFFEQFFGGAARRGRGGGNAGNGGAGFDFFTQQQEPARGADVEADISVTLEEALHGSRRSISLRRSGATGANGKLETYDVKIPAGVHEGQRIRLRSRGEAGPGGGEAGDLYLRVRLAPHADFRVEAGGDLYHDLTVAPWQAVLGCEVTVPTLEKEMHLKIPPGSQVGKRFRLRGRGLPKKKGERTDLYVQIGVTLPEHLSEPERQLWEQLAALHGGKPA